MGAEDKVESITDILYDASLVNAGLNLFFSQPQLKVCLHVSADLLF